MMQMIQTGSYLGIALLSQHLQSPERVSEARLRCKVEENKGEEQHGFRKGRCSIDVIFAMRQKFEGMINGGFNIYLLILREYMS